MSLGLIELVGHTKGARYILSHQYYEFVGKPGEHIRLRGLSTEVRRKTILELIRKNGKVTNSELQKRHAESQGHRDHYYSSYDAERRHY